MLVLTRKPGESIMIGDDVVIKVLSVEGVNVRIGIEAPKEIPVHRDTIYEKIKQENAKRGERYET